MKRADAKALLLTPEDKVKLARNAELRTSLAAIDTLLSTPLQRKAAKHIESHDDLSFHGFCHECQRLTNALTRELNDKTK